MPAIGRSKSPSIACRTTTSPTAIASTCTSPTTAPAAQERRGLVCSTAVSANLRLLLHRDRGCDRQPERHQTEPDVHLRQRFVERIYHCSRQLHWLIPAEQLRRYSGRGRNKPQRSHGSIRISVIGRKWQPGHFGDRACAERSGECAGTGFAGSAAFGRRARRVDDSSAKGRLIRD